MMKRVEADYILLSVGYEDRLIKHLAYLQNVCDEEDQNITIHAIRNHYNNKSICNTEEGKIMDEIGDVSGVLIGISGSLGNEKVAVDDIGFLLEEIIELRHCECLSHQVSNVYKIKFEDKKIMVLHYKRKKRSF